MKAGFVLIAVAAIVGLVGVLAPIDGGALFPVLLKYQAPRALALLAGFVIPLGIALFALAKARMSKPLGFGALGGFVIVGVSIEVWEWVKRLGSNIPVTAVVLLAALGLGIIGSFMAIVKGNND